MIARIPPYCPQNVQPVFPKWVRALSENTVFGRATFPRLHLL